MIAAPRTSVNSPLRIDTLSLPDGLRIGMTICPGKRGSSQYGSAWARDLDADLAVIVAWGAKHVVTAMETAEMERLGVGQMREAMQKAGLPWTQIPISDGAVPDGRFLEIWPGLIESLKSEISCGNPILIHCRGGLGRTGVLACLVLIELGTNAGDALRLVRTARPGTVETQSQQDYVLNYKPITVRHRHQT